MRQKARLDFPTTFLNLEEIGQMGVKTNEVKFPTTLQILEGLSL